jgi:hypothetical protein
MDPAADLVPEPAHAGVAVGRDPGGMHDEAARLVDGDELFVPVEDREHRSGS